VWLEEFENAKEAESHEERIESVQGQQSDRRELENLMKRELKAKDAMRF